MNQANWTFLSFISVGIIFLLAISYSTYIIYDPYGTMGVSKNLRLYGRRGYVVVQRLPDGSTVMSRPGQQDRIVIGIDGVRNYSNTSGSISGVLDSVKGGVHGTISGISEGVSNLANDIHNTVNSVTGPSFSHDHGRYYPGGHTIGARPYYQQPTSIYGNQYQSDMGMSFGGMAPFAAGYAEQPPLIYRGRRRLFGRRRHHYLLPSNGIDSDYPSNGEGSIVVKGRRRFLRPRRRYISSVRSGDSLAVVYKGRRRLLGHRHRYHLTDPLSPVTQVKVKGHPRTVLKHNQKLKIKDRSDGTQYHTNHPEVIPTQIAVKIKGSKTRYLKGVKDARLVGNRKYSDKIYECWSNVPQNIAHDPKYYWGRKDVMIRVPKRIRGRKTKLSKTERVILCIGAN